MRAFGQALVSMLGWWTTQLASQDVSLPKVMWGLRDLAIFFRHQAKIFGGRQQIFLPKPESSSIQNGIGIVGYKFLCFNTCSQQNLMNGFYLVKFGQNLQAVA